MRAVALQSAATTTAGVDRADGAAAIPARASAGCEGSAVATIPILGGTPAAPGNHQWRVVGSDDEAGAAAPACAIGACASSTSATHCDAEHLAGSELHLPTDIGAHSTHGSLPVATTGADGGDVIEPGRWRREGDDLTGVVEGD